MNLFPLLSLEPVVQVGDKTRLDGSKSFISPSGSFTAVQIKPAASASFITVDSDNKWLDWVFAASGTQTVTVRVMTASVTADFSDTISVVTAAQDHLFSNDQDLRNHEADILKYVVDGRSSFLDFHRRAQTLILKWLDKEGYVDINGVPFTKAAIVDIEEVRAWSTFLALSMIFENLSNAIDDVFKIKAKKYEELMIEFRHKALLRLDVDGDGEAENCEGITPAYGFIARR